MRIISIHKALAGLDVYIAITTSCCFHFNPQGPRGPRLPFPLIAVNGSLFQSTRPSRASTQIADLLGDKYAFQSTRPSRASTIPCPNGSGSEKFQSTRPSRASTGTGFLRFFRLCNFNPQGPRGPRLNRTGSFASYLLISIHKALAGLDLNNFFKSVTFKISIHKALAGLDRRTRPHLYPAR